MTIDVTLNNIADISNTTAAQNTINNNSAAIESGFITAVNVTGDVMQGNIDMNSFHLVNLPAPSTSDEPIRLVDVNILNGGGTISNIPSNTTAGQVLQSTSTAYDVIWGNSVTHVGLFMPSDFSVTGGPITSSGQFTVTRNSESSNTFLSGPTSGSATTPTWRALVSVDIPAISLATSAAGGVTGLLPSAQLQGVSTNSNAATGLVGEYISSSLAAGSALALSTNTTSSLTNITLSAGDWDISGGISFTGAASTTVQVLAGIIAATNTSSGGVDLMSKGIFSYSSLSVFTGGSTGPTIIVGPTRVSTATSSSYFLNAAAGFSVSSLSAFGMIRARRVR